MSVITLDDVQKHAATMGLKVTEDHVFDQTGKGAEGGHGYWIENAETGDVAWADENFSSSLYEVAVKLTNHEAAKGTS